MGEIDWLKNPDGTQGISKNYIFGCNGKCLYCYARRIARRFGMAERMAECEMKFKYKNWNWRENEFACDEYQELFYNFKNFIPTFRPSVLAQKLPRKPTMIFFSMSDPAYWKDEWYEKILEKICDHMQHTFVILTKSPRIYNKFSFPHNCWLGVTIEKNKDLMKIPYYLNALGGSCSLYEKTVNNKIFLSVEPIHEKIEIGDIIKLCVDWVIVGPETGRRKNRVIAKPNWIEPFYDLETRVYMKEACKQIVNKKLRQEWPEGYMNGNIRRTTKDYR